jgi:hypothetical protein
MGQRGFDQFVHWHIWFDYNRLVGRIDLQNMVEGADVDDLIALAS